MAHTMQTCNKPVPDQTHREASLAAPMPVAAFRSSFFAQKTPARHCALRKPLCAKRRIIYPPAQDQLGQASPGWIEYASLERGQFRPRSLKDQAVANG